MSHTVRFSLPEDVFARLDDEAAKRCKTRSEYARDATIAYMQKYPAKGAVADIVRSRRADPKNIGSHANSEVITDPALPGDQKPEDGGTYE